jgi:2-isopropylmalate synthase
LIEQKKIPADVTVQVLTQSREHLIRRSFDALKGCPRAIVHLYNSTSPVQRRVTFNKTKEEIKAIAIEGAKLIKKLTREYGLEENILLEYSPESFSDTEVDYALEVCEAVMEVWEPTPKKKIILNLPATVEVATPNVHADQIEWFCRNMKNRDCARISLHTHNDRGTGIAATELGMMAGADRVEGTLFGNGERTGNLDIVTVALNLYTQGVDPKLDFSDLMRIRKVYERCTRMTVHDRHPYAGDLVFTAFSGSHQDAIKKGLDLRTAQKTGDNQLWQVPYLAIDPNDIGRTYEAIIRINSQSGKGGVAYILASEFGFDLPKKLHAEVGAIVNAIADKDSKELTSQEIYDIFISEFSEQNEPLSLVSYDITRTKSEKKEFVFEGVISISGEEKSVRGVGNGPINAFVYAIEQSGLKNFRLQDYREHSIGKGSDAAAAAYVEIEHESGVHFFGCGIDSSIECASLKAIVNAYNRANKN